MLNYYIWLRFVKFVFNSQSGVSLPSGVKDTPASLARYTCFTKHPCNCYIIGLRRHKTTDQSQDISFDFCNLCIPLGIILSQPYSTFVFCIYAKVIFSGSKQTHFLYDSAEDSRPVPGSVSPCSDFHKDRPVGLHPLGCLQAEHKAQPCLSSHLGRVRAASESRSPAAGAAFGSPSLQSIGSGLHTDMGRELLLHSQRTAKNPGWKLGIRKLYSVHNFLLKIFSIDTTSRNTVLLLGTKEAGTGGLLGAVFELSIPRGSHGIQETFLLQAQAASISHPENCDDWQPRTLSRCLPHWTEHSRQSTTMGNFHGFLPLLSSDRPNSFQPPLWNLHGQKILLYPVL